MFGKLKDFLMGAPVTLEVDRDGAPSSKDMQIATGVLLLEMAGSDSDYAPEETRAIFSTMEHQFGISDAETLEVLENADKLRKQEGKIDEFVGLINENFSDKQKQLILAMVWKVVLADELVEKYEQRFATQLRTRLQLSREQAEESKVIAAEGRV